MIIKYSRKYVYLRWRVSTGDPEIFNIFTLGGVQEEGEKDGVGQRAEESPEVFDHPGFSTFVLMVAQFLTIIKNNII